MFWNKGTNPGDGSRIPKHGEGTKMPRGGGRKPPPNKPPPTPKNPYSLAALKEEKIYNKIPETPKTALESLLTKIKMNPWKTAGIAGLGLIGSSLLFGGDDDLNENEKMAREYYSLLD
ncbi:hypothetical protein [Caudoviricetes sp.]|nr:hypothetical protein [Caudoviricetes sp.]